MLSTERQTRRSAGAVPALAFGAVAAFGLAFTPAQAPAQTGSDDSIEEIVVTGIRGSLRQSATMKRESASIVDAISAEDIGKFPDENLAESLQRVTGVSISREDGEGSQVTVRGLGPGFNRILLNGRTAPSSAGQRDFRFEILASELVSSLVVAKTPTAGMYEGGIGGTIFVNTPDPLDSPETRLVGSASVSYDSLSEDYGPRLFGLASTTFADDTMGALFSAAYSERVLREDRIRQQGFRPSASFSTFLDPLAAEPFVNEPENFSPLPELSERDRLNLYGAFQWAPNDSVTAKVDAFYSDFDIDRTEIILNLPPNRGGYVPNAIEIDANGDTTLIDVSNSFGVIANRPSTIYSDLLVVGGNLEWISGGLTVTADLSYSEANQDEDIFVGIIDVPRDPANRTVLDFGNGSRLPDVTTSFSLTDYDSMILRLVGEDFIERSDQEGAAMLDLEWAMDSDLLHSLAAGVSYRDRRFNRSQEQIRLRPGDSARDRADLPQSAVRSFPLDGFLEDESADIPREWAWFDPFELRDAFFDGVTPNRVFLGQNFGSLDESIIGAYFQANLDGDLGAPFVGNVGIRYVYTNQASGGFTPELLGLAPDSRPGDEVFEFGAADFFEDERSYSEWLWSANGRFELAPDLYLRAAAGRTMTRASVEALSPGFSSLSVTARTATTGNPNLDPTLSDQLDLSLEWYQDDGGYVSVAAFYKKLSDVVQTITVLEDLTADGSTQTYNFTRPENADDGEIFGAEFAVQHNLGFLPESLSGFGVLFNYTYADSNISGAESSAIALVDSNLRLEGLSEHNANVVVFYEDDRFSTRLAYNYRSDFLLTTVGNQGLPENRDSYRQLDASASYTVSDNWSLRLEAINLTDEESFTYSDIVARTRFVEYSGTRVFFGVQGSF